MRSHRHDVPGSRFPWQFGSQGDEENRRQAGAGSPLDHPAGDSELPFCDLAQDGGDLAHDGREPST